MTTLKLKAKDIFTIAIILAAIVTLSAQFWSLNKGLIMSDEGWFSCLLRDQPSGIITQFHLIFGKLLGDNLYLGRVLAYLFRIIGITVLAWGAGRLKSKISGSGQSGIHPFIVFFCFITLGQASLGPYSINYYTLSLAFTEISLGLLFLAIANEACWLTIISGFFIAFLIPLKITTISVAVLYAVIIIKYFNNKKVLNLLLFCIGIIVFLVLYFLFVQPFQEYLDFFVKQTNVTIQKGSSDYGIVFLFQWLKEAFVYYGMVLLISYFIYGIYSKFKKQISFGTISKRQQWLFLLCLLLVLVFIWWSDLFPIKGKTFSKPFFLYWLFATILVLSNLNNQKWLLPFIFLLFPLFLSFGSYTAIYKVNLYVPFITLAIAWMIDSKKQYIVMSLCMLLCMYNLIEGEVMKRDWYGNKWLDQTKPLTSIGVNQNIKLDSLNLDLVKNVRLNTNIGENVITDMFGWGVVELAELHPLSYSFRIKTEEAQKKIKDCIENKETINIFLHPDADTEYGSKAELINYMDSLGVMTKYVVGYHRFLFRYEPQEVVISSEQ